MNEKIFKSMKMSGAMNLVLGISTIVLGITAGVLLIVSGSKLLASKPDTLF